MAADLPRRLLSGPDTRAVPLVMLTVGPVVVLFLALALAHVATGTEGAMEAAGAAVVFLSALPLAGKDPTRLAWLPGMAVTLVAPVVALFVTERAPCLVVLAAGGAGVVATACSGTLRRTLVTAAAHLLSVALVASLHPIVPAREFAALAVSATMVGLAASSGAYLRHRWAASSSRLNAPLANVVAHLEYLEHQLRSSLPLTSEEELQDVFATTSAAGPSLTDVVQEWLALESCGEMLSVGPVDVDETLRQVVAGLESYFSDRGLRIQLELGDVGVVSAVESLVSHVCLHLVMHAAQGLADQVLVVQTRRDGDTVQLTTHPLAGGARSLLGHSHRPACLCEAIVRGLQGRCAWMQVGSSRQLTVSLPASLVPQARPH